MVQAVIELNNKLDIALRKYMISEGLKRKGLAITTILEKYFSEKNG